ncbi:putative serine protease HhoB precursor [Botrimarina colliarenosi]|uniref:Putative serine protease HhoB n=2 Tax=Botrimarina colliarenosi TaxID=2528001 RepID=A0A5C6AA92_9BACT|nr:putative serine protease HhoB precursor [Botrimarina colliarenosi]
MRMTPIVRAVKAARPAVVNIQGQKSVPDEKGPTGAVRQVNGMGTGVVIDPRGYVLTNHHVVDGVRQIRVTLDDGTMDIARVVAHDKRTDLAVIKIEVGRPLPVIEVGSSLDLMPGEPVIAVGNAYGYEHTVTRGIISALGRDVQVSDTQAYDDLIQTDASINPGNSGGPLLSIEGKMIGLNVAVRAGAQGIGFAIPIDQALQVAADLMSVERLENKWHGIEIGTTRDGSSTIVRRVAPGSPAAQGGVRPGDVITRLGDVDVARALDVERALLGRPVGERVAMEVRRSGQAVDLGLTVARRGSGPVREVAARLASSTTPTEDDGAWQVLGMKLNVEPKSTFESRSSRYRGGMRVVDVRADGPAAAKGIRSGDILVGMHRWETASEEDIRYIVTNDALGSLDEVKFYILRGDETLYGAMRVNVTRR